MTHSPDRRREAIARELKALPPHNGYVFAYGGDPSRYVIDVPLILRDEIIAILLSDLGEGMGQTETSTAIGE